MLSAEEQEALIIRLKTQNSEKEAINEVHQETIKEYIRQLKQYRGIDLEKYRSMEAECKMLKNFQQKQDNHILRLENEMEWHRKMGAEKSSQM